MGGIGIWAQDEPEWRYTNANGDESSEAEPIFDWQILCPRQLEYLMFYALQNQTSDIGPEYLNWVGNYIDLIYIHQLYPNLQC